MKCEICGRDNLTERELSIHLKFYHKTHSTMPQSQEPPQRIAFGACPDCGSTLWFGEGCATCRSCGYSKCG